MPKKKKDTNKDCVYHDLLTFVYVLTAADAALSQLEGDNEKPSGNKRITHTKLPKMRDIDNEDVNQRGFKGRRGMPNNNNNRYGCYFHAVKCVYGF